jgi:formaldehyde-activating enzyme involved in methanogenesis
MKVSQVCNALLTIQANTNKAGDFETAQQVAQLMADSGEVVLCSECDTEQWVQVATVWNHFQAQELRDLYNVAKRAL